MACISTFDPPKKVINYIGSYFEVLKWEKNWCANSDHFLMAEYNGFTKFFTDGGSHAQI